MAEQPNLRPLGDKVIVRKLDADDNETTSSGIVLVSNERNDKTKRAEVVSVGPGATSNGVRIPMTVAVGDTVLYNGQYGTDIGGFHTSSKNEYLILHEEDIIAIVAQ